MTAINGPRKSFQSVMQTIPYRNPLCMALFFVLGFKGNNTVFQIADVWSEVEAKLEIKPGLEAKTLFED